MAEDEQGGGGKGTLSLPKIGDVKKKPVLIVGGLAAAYVIWRYYQASQAGASADATAGDSDGDGYADAGTIPAVSGQGPISGYTDTSTTDNSSDSYGFHGTTNSQWTQYASTQLSAAGDKWSYGDVLDALGAFLANRPLTSVQQQIVQAAKAAAGEPPEGTHPIIPGGDTPITVAPPDVKVTSTTADGATLSWGAVAGASEYWVYRSGTNAIVQSTGTSRSLTGLKANTSYSFQVAARSASGTLGPKSTAVTAKTKPVTLAKPTGVKASGVTRTSAVVSCSAVAGAGGYNWYINGVAHGHSDAPRYTVVSLKPNTSYKVKVTADTSNQSPGPASGEVSFRTKK